MDLLYCDYVVNIMKIRNYQNDHYKGNFFKKNKGEKINFFFLNKNKDKH